MSRSGDAGSLPVVAFAMEWVPQYRLQFYEQLRAELADRGVQMRLIHGDPPSSRKLRNDSRIVEWADYVPNKHRSVGRLELTAQPVVKLLKGADLVILQQETGLLLNYLMMVKARLGGPKVALWGHGHNFNPHEASGLAEAVKRRVTKFADWAFAYTERSASVFESIGVDPKHITVVQNSLDITPIRHPSGEMSAEVAKLISELKVDGANVAWIVSAFDNTKRVPFLLEVLDLCAERIEEFAFVALGAGDHAGILSEAAKTRPWLHALGARFGADKAAIGQLASLTIHPGLAGLHVIESFATESPMVTADIDFHSHEVSYLSADNSVVLSPDADADSFARAIEALFAAPSDLVELQAGCRSSAEEFTLEAMVENFATGVVDALAEFRQD